MHRAEKINSRIGPDREMEKRSEKHRQKLDHIKSSLHTKPPKKQPYFRVHLRQRHRVLKPSHTSNSNSSDSEYIDGKKGAIQPTQPKGPGTSSSYDDNSVKIKEASTTDRATATNVTTSRNGITEEDAYADELFEEENEPLKSTEARSSSSLTTQNTTPKRSYFSIKSKRKALAPANLQSHRTQAPIMKTIPGYENVTNLSSGMSVYLPTVAHPIKALVRSPTKEKVNLIPGFRSLRKGMPEVPSLPPLQADESLSGTFHRTIQTTIGTMNGTGSSLDTPNSFKKMDIDFNLTANQPLRGTPLYKTGSFVGGTYLVVSVYHGHTIQNSYGFDLVVWHPEKKRKYELEISKQMTNEFLEAVSSCSTAAQSRALSGTNLSVEKIAKRICEHVNYTRIGREGQGEKHGHELGYNQSQGEMVFLVSSALANSLNEEEVLISVAPTSMAFIAHQNIELWSVKSQSKKPYHLTITTKNTLSEEQLSIHFRAQEIIKQEGDQNANDGLEVTMTFQELWLYLRKKFDLRRQVLSPEVIVLESIKYLSVNDNVLELIQTDELLKPTTKSSLSQDIVLYSGMIWKQTYLLTRVRPVDSTTLPPPEYMSQVKEVGFIISVLNPHTNMWMERILTRQQMDRALETLVAAQHHQDMIEALQETKCFCSQLLRHVTFEMDLKRQEVLCFPLLLGVEDEKAMRNCHGTSESSGKAQSSQNSPKSSDNIQTNTAADHHQNEKVGQGGHDRHDGNEHKAVVRIQACWRGTAVRSNLRKEGRQDKKVKVAQQEEQEASLVVERDQHHHSHHHIHTHQPIIKAKSYVGENFERKSTRRTARPEISQVKSKRPLTPRQGRKSKQTPQMLASPFNSKNAKSIQMSNGRFSASKPNALLTSFFPASFTNSSTFIHGENARNNQGNGGSKEKDEVEVEEEEEEEEEEDEEDSTDSSTVVTIASSCPEVDIGGLNASKSRHSMSFQIVLDQVQETESIYESDDNAAILIQARFRGYSMRKQLKEKSNDCYLIKLKLNDGEEKMLEDVKSQLREHLDEAEKAFISEELLHTAAKSIQDCFRKQQAKKKNKKKKKKENIHGDTTTDAQVKEDKVKHQDAYATEILIPPFTTETVVQRKNSISFRQGKKIIGQWYLVKIKDNVITSTQMIGPCGQLLL